jgi:hypothetical protein
MALSMSHCRRAALMPLMAATTPTIPRSKHPPVVRCPQSLNLTRRLGARVTGGIVEARAAFLSSGAVDWCWRLFADARHGVHLPAAHAAPAAGPTLGRGAVLTKAQLRALPKNAGRQRGSTSKPAASRPRCARLPTPPAAQGRERRPPASTLVRPLDAVCINAEELDVGASAHFDQHPDAETHHLIRRISHLARVPAEIRYDRSRHADIRAPRAFANAAPAVRA